MRFGASPVGGRELGYAEATVAQGGIQTITDLTGLSVTVNVGSRPIKIIAEIDVTKQTNAGVIAILLREGSTVLNTKNSPTLAINGGATVHVESRLAPTPGTHTYKVSMVATTATGTMAAAGGTGYISFIQVVEC